MKFLDFFDPLDIDHLTAYQHLQKNGTWPIKFIPDNIEFEPNWQMSIQAKMADLWVGTNIFMHNMKPSEEPDGVIDLDRLLKIGDNFDKKRKKNKG